MANIRTCLASSLLLLSTAAQAGGSWEEVVVRSVRLVSATDYELVVAREPNEDGYLGKCKVFTVLGTYAERPAESRWWDIWDRFPESVTLEGHLAALALLQTARSSGEHVNFGWMGSGFELIDAAHPCTVRSRALEIRREEGEIAVLSYFHRV